MGPRIAVLVLALSAPAAANDCSGGAPAVASANRCQDPEELSFHALTNGTAGLYCVLWCSANGKRIGYAYRRPGQPAPERPEPEAFITDGDGTAIGFDSANRALVGGKANAFMKQMFEQQRPKIEDKRGRLLEIFRSIVDSNMPAFQFISDDGQNDGKVIPAIYRPPADQGPRLYRT